MVRAGRSGWLASLRYWGRHKHRATKEGDRQMDSTLSALLGAILGGAMSVLASWLAQRTQSASQLRAQEIKQRQQLYSEFVGAASCCFADGLLQNEPEPASLAKLYGEVGRMQLVSSEPVIKEAERITHKILSAYAEENRSKIEVGDFLAQNSVELFSQFGRACRAELSRLEPGHLSSDAISWPSHSA